MRPTALRILFPSAPPEDAQEFPAGALDESLLDSEKASDEIQDADADDDDDMSVASDAASEASSEYSNASSSTAPRRKRSSHQRRRSSTSGKKSKRGSREFAKQQKQRRGSSNNAPDVEAHLAFQRPGDYRHADFHDAPITSIQGLVYMPNRVWHTAHMAAASFLCFLGLAQLIVGGVVLRFYRFDFAATSSTSSSSTSGETEDEEEGDSAACGSTTFVAAVASLLSSFVAYRVWALFEPRSVRPPSCCCWPSSASSPASLFSASRWFDIASSDGHQRPTDPPQQRRQQRRYDAGQPPRMLPAAPFVSRAEQSRCGDPRRLLMLLALVTAALTAASLATDGAACKRAIDDFDICYDDDTGGVDDDAATSHGDDFYGQQCNVALKKGAECACVTFHGGGGSGGSGDAASWECSYMLAGPIAGSLGGAGCAGAAGRLSSWLTAGSYTSALALAVATGLLTLGAASCASHPLFFRPVTVARLSETADDGDYEAAAADDSFAGARSSSFSASGNFELGGVGGRSGGTGGEGAEF